MPKGPTEPSGIPIPRGVLRKRLQAVENKGTELQKERQESSRARNSMKRRDLRSGAGRKDRNVAKTHRVAGKRRGETGTLSAEPWFREYRIGYYSSSEK